MRIRGSFLLTVQERGIGAVYSRIKQVELKENKLNWEKTSWQYTHQGLLWLKAPCSLRLLTSTSRCRKTSTVMCKWRWSRRLCRPLPPPGAQRPTPGAQRPANLMTNQLKRLQPSSKTGRGQGGYRGRGRGERRGRGGYHGKGYQTPTAVFNGVHYYRPIMIMVLNYFLFILQ